MRASRSAMSRACLATFALTIATGFPGQAQVETFTPVTDAVLQHPDPADWLMWRRTLDSWGYSPLDQVDRDNVDELRVYIGTSLTSPAPKFMLGGITNKHLYHNSTLALDADTGEIMWYYQHLNDHWDLDHPFERLLVDTAVTPDATAVHWINPRLQPGEMRKVITGCPISYAVDGTQYVAVSTGSSITSAAFGRLTPELQPSSGNNLFVFALP